MTAEWGVAESRHSTLDGKGDGTAESRHSPLGVYRGQGTGDRGQLVKPSENQSLVIVSANSPVFTDQ